MFKKIYFFLIIGIVTTTTAQLPDGFVYLHDKVPTIKKELRYLTENNFIGKPIAGYISNCLITTKETAIALNKIQSKLLKQGLGLKIFDAYRPQQAVNNFVQWAKVLNDTLKKESYYPNVPKNKLFTKGYISSRSGHSRGSTVDVTIINLKTTNELDMGSAYDYFGVQSHPFFDKISKEQKKNRMLLRKIMIAHNFRPYKNEWWHFTLRQEPFPKTYFNFPVD